MKASARGPREPPRGSQGGRGPRLRNPEAIEAQKQKECHPQNLSAWYDSDRSQNT